MNRGSKHRFAERRRDRTRGPAPSATLGLGALLLISAAAPEPSHLVLYPVMKNDLDTASRRLVDVGQRFSVADAGVARLSPSEWRRAANAAMRVAETARSLTTAERIDVIRPRDEAQRRMLGWATGQAIQRHIAADRSEFNARAREMDLVARQILAAARARDIARLAGASARLDDTCEACHLQFWYPHQMGTEGGLRGNAEAGGKSAGS